MCHLFLWNSMLHVYCCWGAGAALESVCPSVSVCLPVHPSVCLSALVLCTMFQCCGWAGATQQRCFWDCPSVCVSSCQFASSLFCVTCCRWAGATQQRGSGEFLSVCHHSLHFCPFVIFCVSVWLSLSSSSLFQCCWWNASCSCPSVRPSVWLCHL